MARTRTLSKIRADHSGKLTQGSQNLAVSNISMVNVNFCSTVLKQTTALQQKLPGFLIQIMG